MTVFSGSWRRSGALITVAAAGMLGVGLSAVPASAHTPAWTVDCSTVTVTLKNYDNKPGNTVTVTDVTDNKKLLDETFQTELQKEFPLDSHSQEIKLHLSVKSADGQGAVEEDATSPVCPGQESSSPAPSASTPAPETSSPAVESPAPSADASTSAAAVLPTSQPSPAGDDLAETGSSSSTPMIAGGAAVVLIAGAGILWASRKRRATQH